MSKGNLKTFKDLNFRPHPAGYGKAARLFFDNGYGVSVVRFRTIFGLGYGSYTNNELEWELAVLHGDEGNAELCYASPITNDVIGHLTANQVTKVMKRVQLLPVNENCSHWHKEDE
jgi:hypothetical protein